ncbi:hypothetical protein LDENG_00035070 [Lucifuga dentata]|nr:hypothetical protein LDENG_00035070 [Lucifuga dentata]
MLLQGFYQKPTRDHILLPFYLLFTACGSPPGHSGLQVRSYWSSLISVYRPVEIELSSL